MKRAVARSVRLLSGDAARFAMHVTIGKETATYHVAEVGSPDARHGFEVEKVDDAGHVLEVYGVELYCDHGGHSCSCRGFVAHGHCRHVSAIAALLSAGLLSAVNVAN